MAELPLVIDQTIYQGATWRLHYRWLPGGVGRNFTGWTGRLQIRESYADQDTSAPLLSLTTENGGITLGSDGSIAILATDTQTQALTKTSTKRYDLELIAPSAGDVTRFLMGKITIEPEVTRA